MRYPLYILLLVITYCSQSFATDLPFNGTITNPKLTDGFGAQFQAIISSVIYAELNNYRYVYTPFCSMEHNYFNDTEFLAKKEHLINFIGNFEINTDTTTYSTTACKAFFDAHVSPCAQSVSLTKIKEIFRANKNSTNDFGNNNLNIVIHIRRHNQHDSRTLGTDTPDKFFMDMIKSLRTVYAKQNPLFHIHSQGNITDFNVFRAPDTVLHLNESIEDTFTAMVLADVLVISQSSFSYTAGLLSDGIVYYIPFWHSPLPHWSSIEQLHKSCGQVPVIT
jgi:hypothetical protein